MSNQYCIRIIAKPNQLILTSIDQLQSVDQLEIIESEASKIVKLKVASSLNLADLKNNLMLISEQYQADIIVKHWHERDITAGLLIMDMDSTLVQAETIDEIARVAGVGEQVAEITESAMRGELDFTESLNARVAMLKGVSVGSLADVHLSLPLTEGAKNLLSKAAANNCHTALVSGGFTLFAQPIANSLGFDTLSANTLEIIDGKLTGKVVDHIVDGESKLQTLNQLKSQLGLSKQQIVAIGDGANDLPMLTAAGTGIAFHAKPKVQQQADALLNYNDLNAVCWLLGW